MPVAGIVEAQAREWWGPVFQYGLQVSGGEMSLHPEITDESQPEAFDHQDVIIEGEPIRHIHRRLLAAFFELPAIKLTARHAPANAFVVEQIRR